MSWALQRGLAWRELWLLGWLWSQAETSWEDKGCGGRLASVSLSSAVCQPALPSYHPPRSKTWKSRIGGSFLLLLLTPTSASLTKEVPTHRQRAAGRHSLIPLPSAQEPGSSRGEAPFPSVPHN